MKLSRRSTRIHSFGKRQDYRSVLRRRERIKEIVIWAVEIAIVVMLAFLAAYFFF